MAGKKNKGKAPKGRAASKQKAKRGASGAASSPFSSHFIRGSGWERAAMLEDDDDDEGNDHAFRGFRGFAQTKSSHNAFSPRNTSTNTPNLRLRHQAITFVSASPLSQLHGEVEQTEQLEVVDVDSDGEGFEDEDEDEDGLDADVSLHTNIITETQEGVARMKLQSSGEAVEDDSDQDVSMTDLQHDTIRQTSPEPFSFVIDTTGDANLTAGLPTRNESDTGRREPSPAPSNSSEEVVLFHGRGPIIVNDPPSSSKTRSNNAITSTSSTLPTSNGPGGDGMAKGWAAYPGAWEKDVNPNAKWAPAPSGSWWRKGKAREELSSSGPETKAPDAGANRESTVKLAQPQLGAFSTNIIPLPESVDRNNGTASGSKPDKETRKKIEKLACMIRVQARDDAFPPNRREKKLTIMARRAAMISQVQSELSAEQIEQATQMAAAEETRLKEARSGAKHGRPQASANDAEDTIAALQAEWKAVVRTKNQAKPVATGANTIPLSTSKPTRRGKRGRKSDNRALRDLMSDDDDEIGEAAYDDYMANLAAQLSNDEEGGLAAFTFSSAPDGGPSLVVNGEEIADDELLHENEPPEESYATAMNGEESSSESSGPLGEDLSEISDFDSSELEENLEYTEQEQWEDDEDLRRRRQEQMTDEQIARIFAKQEELGIHDDEMILEDGNYGSLSEDMDGVGDIDAARAGLAKYSLKPTKKRDRSGHFPNAAAFADTLDQYGADGFDIMDFDRPSLRNTKNGRKGKLPPELEALSDEDLKANMMDAWDNDRDKKRLKKAEREELRRQGLLGAAGKKGKADFGQKYQYGITMAQIHEEVRAFLNDSTQQARAFPAMAKNDRKTLHELALALGLNSKSVGTGVNRKPVVYKNSRTPAYDVFSFQSAISRSERGLLDRDRKLGKKKGAGGKAPKMPRGVGGGAGPATIRNGEVVGAGAAQISTESKGYKLLAKMGGWKEGMALGREGEGRLEPVQQVMRAGRSGLGDWR